MLIEETSPAHIAEPEPVKPPPQVAGAGGIAPGPVMQPSQPDSIDWASLVSYPPFQMFVEERQGRVGVALGGSYDTEGNARYYVQGVAERDALFERYCQWHEAKGLWPAETPMGKLKE